MPAILALIPSWAYRWIAIIGVAAAFGGFCYIRGIDHQEDADAVVQAKQVAEALKLQQFQQAATTKRINTYEAEIANLNAVPPAIVHDRVVAYVHGLCNAPTADGTGVPASPGVGVGGTGADAPVRSTDIDPSELEHDIKASERNSAKLSLCSGWVGDNGGSKP